MRSLNIFLVSVLIWMMQSSPVCAQWTPMKFDAGSVRYIVATDSFLFALTSNHLYRSGKENIQWTLMDVSIKQDAQLLSFDQKLYLLNDKNVKSIVESSDHGESWKEIITSSGVASVSGIYMYKSQLHLIGKIVAGANFSSIYKYNGSAWSHVNNINGEIVFNSTENDTVYFTRVNSPQHSEILYYSNPQTVKILISFNDNTTFGRVRFAGSFYTISNKTTIISINGDGLFHSTTPVPSAKTIQSISAYAGFFFAVILDQSGKRFTYYTDDPENEWTLMDSPFEDIHSILKINNNYFTACPDGIYQSADFVSWKFVTAGINELKNFNMFSIDNRLFLSARDSMFYSDDKGDNWLASNAPEIPVTNTFEVYKIEGLSIIQTTENNLFYSEDEGLTWIEPELPEHISLEAIGKANDRIYFRRLNRNTSKTDYQSSSNMSDFITLPLMNFTPKYLYKQGDTLYAFQNSLMVHSSANNGGTWKQDHTGLQQGNHELNKLQLIDGKILVYTKDNNSSNPSNDRLLTRNNGRWNTTNFNPGTETINNYFPYKHLIYIPRKERLEYTSDFFNSIEMHELRMDFTAGKLDGPLFMLNDILYANLKGEGIWKAKLDYHVAVENQQKEKLNLYPNPVVSILKIKNADHILNYTIFDFSGKLIEHKSYDQSGIKVEKLTSGIYFLKAEFENGFYSFEKFIKQ